MPELSDHDLLVELNVKVDILTLQLQEHRGHCEPLHTRHEERLTQLERWQGKAIGVIAAIMFVVTLAGNAIVRALTGY